MGGGGLGLRMGGGALGVGMGGGRCRYQPKLNRSQCKRARRRALGRGGVVQMVGKAVQDAGGAGLRAWRALGGWAMGSWRLHLSQGIVNEARRVFLGGIDGI